MRSAIVISIGCLLLLACENDEKAIKALTQKQVSVDIGINIETYYSQAGKVKAKLTAPLMKSWSTDTSVNAINAPYVEFPKSLHVDFYNDTMLIESRLDARYGRYRVNEKKVFLKDSVVVFNIQGDTLRTQELWWDRYKQQFYTEKPARIYRKDRTIIYGQNGLTASQDFSEVTIHESSGQIPIKDSL